MSEFRNVSGVPEDLEGGRIIGVGETFTLSDEDLKASYNKTKIEEGRFLRLDNTTQSTQEAPSRDDLLRRATELNIKGRHDMNINELQQHIGEAEAKQEQKGGRG